MAAKPSLRLFAGPKAKQHLIERGLRAEDIHYMLAASGGPKWMALFGLDQYLTQSFFPSHHPLAIIGSSAGAMRACCYAQRDASAAIQRFADIYTLTRYDSKPSPRDISNSARVLLDYLLDEQGLTDILSSPRSIHIIASRCHGLSQYEHPWLQGLGLVTGFLLNRLSRKLLDIHYERVVFFSGNAPLMLEDYTQLKTHYVSLSEDNLYQAALASGSIPMVMEGVRHIHNAPTGTYRDGGIIDYHFDLSPGEGLCLYPHFTCAPRPAWFDKFGQRKIHSEHYANTLMLAPSEDFVASLPHRKIPDRKDFANMTDEERERVWRHCQQASFALAEEFDHLLHTQDWQGVEDLDQLG